MLVAVQLLFHRAAQRLQLAGIVFLNRTQALMQTGAQLVGLLLAAAAVPMRLLGQGLLHRGQMLLQLLAAGTGLLQSLGQMGFDQLPQAIGMQLLVLAQGVHHRLQLLGQGLGLPFLAQQNMFQLGPGGGPAAPQLHALQNHHQGQSAHHHHVQPIHKESFYRCSIKCFEAF